MGSTKIVSRTKSVSLLHLVTSIVTWKFALSWPGNLASCTSVVCFEQNSAAILPGRPYALADDERRSPFSLRETNKGKTIRFQYHLSNVEQKAVSIDLFKVPWGLNWKPVSSVFMGGTSMIKQNKCSISFCLRKLTLNRLSGPLRKGPWD